MVLVCVFLCRRVRLPTSCATAESTDREWFQASASSRCLGLLERALRFGSVSASRSQDQESYPYRIGTVHMCRDAAYADAGVRSGALRGEFRVNFSGVALDV